MGEGLKNRGGGEADRGGLTVYGNIDMTFNR